MSSPLVSAELTESFRARGFVVVPDLLTATELPAPPTEPWPGAEFMPPGLPRSS